MADCALSTPAPEIHELAGSSKPGATRPVFKPVPPPKPRPQTRPRNEREVSATHLGCDAEVIELAQRVKALAERNYAHAARSQRIWDSISARHPSPFECSGRTATQEEFKAHRELVGPIEERLGLPRLQNVGRRMVNRLVRWTRQLAVAEPATMAGLGAKAAAVLAVREADRFDLFTDEVAEAVNRDAVRLASARQPCAELARLVAEWRIAEDVARDADDRREAIAEAIVLPEWPKAMRFRVGADETYIGGYQNFHEPYGYTDPKKIAQLRAGVAPIHQPRADEIVAAFDAWTAACDAAREDAGLPDADAARDRTRDVEVALRRRIVATPAGCAEDLRLKAEVAVWCYGTLADVEAETAQAARAGHCGDTEAAAAVLLDVVRLLGADAMPAAAVPPGMTPASNIRPAPLASMTFPAGRYPAGMTRELVESYRTFLDMELRFLNWETQRSPDAVGGFWLDNPAGSFHGNHAPPPSTRAATVLGLLGLMPTETFDGQPLPDQDAA